MKPVLLQEQLRGGAKDIENDYLRILNLSLFKAAPDILKNQIYRNGNWLVVENGRNNKYVNDFNFFINNLNTSNIRPTFRMYHSVLTHSPIKVNSDCSLLKNNLSRSYKNYLKQDTCGLSLVGKILDKLKELGIYDNTYIIISSDHGRAVVPSELAQKFEATSNISPKEYGSAHSTLLIKPLNSNSGYKESNKPMSLLVTSQ